MNEAKSDEENMVPEVTTEGGSNQADLTFSDESSSSSDCYMSPTVSIRYAQFFSLLHFSFLLLCNVRIKLFYRKLLD